MILAMGSGAGTRRVFRSSADLVKVVYSLWVGCPQTLPWWGLHQLLNPPHHHKSPGQEAKVNFIFLFSQTLDGCTNSTNSRSIFNSVCTFSNIDLATNW